MAAQDAKNDPSTPSIAHQKLAPEWAKIQAIRSGAMAVKEGGETYLPKWPSETADEYKRRKECAPWRPEFEDICRTIAAKPFGKTVHVTEDAPEWAKEFAEDVDGRGNNLHTFARDFFETGIALGLAGIMVDYPAVDPDATRAEEQTGNVRPYFVEIAADEIIAWEVQRQGAKEVTTHLRLREFSIERDGFEEKLVERIRVYEPGQWMLFRKQKGQNGADEWVLESEGRLTLPEITFVPFATGDREGTQMVRPPLHGLANMQIELYRQLSAKEQIFTMSAAPMLSANGMGAPDGDTPLEVGPNRILFAPGSSEYGQASWSYLQPDARNLAEVREDWKDTVQDMRRLGMQPLMPRTGGVTATGQSLEASRAHTAVQSWALDLKDALERAFGFAGQWLGQDDETEVFVHTDFAVGVYGADEIRELREARKAGEISHQTFIEEMVRRGVLNPSLDYDEEVERILNDLPGEEEDEQQLNALPPANTELRTQDAP